MFQHMTESVRARKRFAKLSLYVTHACKHCINYLKKKKKSNFNQCKRFDIDVKQIKTITSIYLFRMKHN